MRKLFFLFFFLVHVEERGLVLGSYATFSTFQTPVYEQYHQFLMGERKNEIAREIKCVFCVNTSTVGEFALSSPRMLLSLRCNTLSYYDDQACG